MGKICWSCLITLWWDHFINMAPIKLRYYIIRIGWNKFVWQCSALRVERVVERIFQEVDEWRRVDVGKTVETSSEIRWVVVRSEQAAKTLVEQLLHHLSRYTHMQSFYHVRKENLIKQKWQCSIHYFTRLFYISWASVRLYVVSVLRLSQDCFGCAKLQVATIALSYKFLL